MAVVLIVRVPNRRSRPMTISIPSVRTPFCKRSDALPLYCALSAMISRTTAATGSLSMISHSPSPPATAKPLLSFTHTNETNIGLLPVLRV